MSQFRCKHGRVDYDTSPFHGNCGALIIHSVSFEPISGHYYKRTDPWEEGSTAAQMDKCAKEVAGLYKEFNSFLLKDYNTNRNKLLMSDAVGGEDGRKRPSIYGMCKKNKWRKGKATFNGNSGNNIVVFEIDRPAGVIKRAS